LSIVVESRDKEANAVERGDGGAGDADDAARGDADVDDAEERVIGTKGLD
jgi:hypothetical protein